MLMFFMEEAKRRKWLEENPETTSNDEPVLFDTSIIPWWAWIKRYHLPEAELLNGLFVFISKDQSSKLKNTFLICYLLNLCRSCCNDRLLHGLLCR